MIRCFLVTMVLLSAIMKEAHADSQDYPLAGKAGKKEESPAWMIDRYDSAPSILPNPQSRDQEPIAFGFLEPHRPDHTVPVCRSAVVGRRASTAGRADRHRRRPGRSAVAGASDEANVHSRGPLGALYPLKTWTAPNPHSCLKEGDTPSWFFFLARGGNDPDDPTKPGWGGQYQRQPDGWYRDQPAADAFDPRTTVSRWRPAFQADFARRMAWCVE